MTQLCSIDLKEIINAIKHADWDHPKGAVYSVMTLTRGHYSPTLIQQMIQNHIAVQELL